MRPSKKNAKKNILLLVCEIFVYICIELSTNQNTLKMKRNVIFYAITAAGDEIKYEPRPLVKPERTKLWSRLNFWLLTEQVQKIGYYNEQ